MLSVWLFVGDVLPNVSTVCREGLVSVLVLFETKLSGRTCIAKPEHERIQSLTKIHDISNARRL